MLLGFMFLIRYILKVLKNKFLQLKSPDLKVVEKANLLKKHQFYYLLYMVIVIRQSWGTKSKIGLNYPLTWDKAS